MRYYCTLGPPKIVGVMLLIPGATGVVTGPTGVPGNSLDTNKPGLTTVLVPAVMTPGTPTGHPATTLPVMCPEVKNEEEAPSKMSTTEGATDT